jgi:hypothetical protein
LAGLHPRNDLLQVAVSLRLADPGRQGRPLGASEALVPELPGLRLDEAITRSSNSCPQYA